MIPFRRFSFLHLGCAAFLVSMLAGCSDQVYAPDDQFDSSSPAIELSSVPPPAPSEEMKEGLTDLRTQIWRPGHWDYQNERFYWVPGEVLTRPSPTAVWSPDRWEHRKYGWVFVHGYWQ